MSDGWPNKRASAYLGGDPPGILHISAIGSGREHILWCATVPSCFIPSREPTFEMPVSAAVGACLTSPLPHHPQGMHLLPLRPPLPIHLDLPPPVLRRVLQPHRRHARRLPLLRVQVLRVLEVHRPFLQRRRGSRRHRQARGRTRRDERRLAQQARQRIPRR